MQDVENDDASIGSGVDRNFGVVRCRVLQVWRRGCDADAGDRRAVGVSRLALGSALRGY